MSVCGGCQQEGGKTIVTRIESTPLATADAPDVPILLPQSKYA